VFLDPVNAFLKGSVLFPRDIGNRYQALYNFLVIFLILLLCALLVGVDDFHLQGEDFQLFALLLLCGF